MVGPTATGIGDRFSTPFDRVMPGVEIFATPSATSWAATDSSGTLLKVGPRDETEKWGKVIRAANIKSE
jgi:hypothetical protein